MEENNKQDPKFKDLSTKKKIFHYVGWPLLVLGCVGTIIFGSLWCKARNSSASGSVREINFTTDEWHSEELRDDDPPYDAYGSSNEVTKKVANGAKSSDRFKLNINFKTLPSLAKRADFELEFLAMIVSDQDPYEHVEDPTPVPTHKILTIKNVVIFEDDEEVRPLTFAFMSWYDPSDAIPYNEGGQIFYQPGWTGYPPSIENTFPHDLDIFNSVLSFEFSLFDDISSDFYVSLLFVLNTTNE